MLYNPRDIDANASYCLISSEFDLHLVDWDVQNCIIQMEWSFMKFSNSSGADILCTNCDVLYNVSAGSTGDGRTTMFDTTAVKMAKTGKTLLLPIIVAPLSTQDPYFSRRLIAFSLWRSPRCLISRFVAFCAGLCMDGHLVSIDNNNDRNETWCGVMQQDPWSRMSFVVCGGWIVKIFQDVEQIRGMVESTHVTEENAACPSVRVTEKYQHRITNGIWNLS